MWFVLSSSNVARISFEFYSNFLQTLFSKDSDVKNPCYDGKSFYFYFRGVDWTHNDSIYLLVDNSLKRLQFNLSVWKFSNNHIILFNLYNNHRLSFVLIHHCVLVLKFAVCWSTIVKSGKIAIMQVSLYSI